MKKLLATILVFLAILNAEFSSELNGTFICDVKMISDGSDGQKVLVIQEKTVKSKPLGFDDAWFLNYT